MKVNKLETSNSTLNVEKTNNLFNKLVDVYQDAKPTAAEIIVSLSNLIYTLGASIGGYKDTGPSLDELQKIYYTNPSRIDVALMLQGITMSSWFETLNKQSNNDLEDTILKALESGPVKPDNLVALLSDRFDANDIYMVTKTLLIQKKVSLNNSWELEKGE